MRPGIGTLLGLQAEIHPPTELMVGAERLKIARREAEAKAKREKYKDLRNIWSSDLAGIDVRYHGGIKDIASEIREKAMELKEQGITNIEGHETIAPLMYQLESGISSAKQSTKQIVTETSGVASGALEGIEKAVADYGSPDFDKWNTEYNTRPFVYKAGSIGRVIFDEIKEVYKPMQSTLKDWIFEELPEFETREKGYEIFSKQKITSEAKIGSEAELYYDTNLLHQSRVNERFIEAPPDIKEKYKDEINPALEWEKDKDVERFTKDMKEYYIKSRYKGIPAAPEPAVEEPEKAVKEIKLYSSPLDEVVNFATTYLGKGSTAFAVSNVINKEATILMPANAISLEDDKAVHSGSVYPTNPKFTPVLKANDHVVLSRPGAVYKKGDYITRKDDVKEAREKGFDTKYVKGVIFDSYSLDVIGTDEEKTRIPKNRVITLAEFDDVSIDIKTIDPNNYKTYEKGLTEEVNRLNKDYRPKIKIPKAEEIGRISKEAKPILEEITTLKAKEKLSDKDKKDLRDGEGEIRELINELRALTGKEPLPEEMTIWKFGIENIKKLFEGEEIEEVKPETTISNPDF